MFKKFLLFSAGHWNVYDPEVSALVVRLIRLSAGCICMPDPKIMASAPPANEIPWLRPLNLVSSKIPTPRRTYFSIARTCPAENE